MSTMNLKTLVSKLNEPCRKALESAAALCLSRTHYNVEIEHWLAKLLENTTLDLSLVLQQFGVNFERLQADVTRALDRLRSGNAKTPALAPDIVEWIRTAWVFASLEHQTQQVRSG